VNRIATDPRLPQRISLTEQYLSLLNIRLFELFKSIAAQINAGADGFLGNVTTVTTAYTATQFDQVILVNNTGNIPITIPAAADTLNKRLIVKKISNNANTVTIGATNGNIEGAATKVLSTYLASSDLVSDGANYWLV